MRRPPEEVTGLILAAGGSSRLGRPKQLLPYGGGTLLGHVVDVARACSFDQTVVALGGSADEVRASVDLDGVDVIVNDAYGEGCSSSIAAALPLVRGDILVLMLGDQPGVTPETVRTLLTDRGGSEIAVCSYDDGRGHPFAFQRAVYGALGSLHGDKAVWKLLDQRGADVAEVAIAGPVPPDVDTWDDYTALVAASP